MSTGTVSEDKTQLALSAEESVTCGYLLQVLWSQVNLNSEENSTINLKYNVG